VRGWITICVTPQLTGWEVGLPRYCAPVSYRHQWRSTSRTRCSRGTAGPCPWYLQLMTWARRSPVNTHCSGVMSGCSMFVPKSVGFVGVGLHCRQTYGPNRMLAYRRCLRQNWAWPFNRWRPMSSFPDPVDLCPPRSSTFLAPSRVILQSWPSSVACPYSGGHFWVTPLIAVNGPCAFRRTSVIDGHHRAGFFLFLLFPDHGGQGPREQMRPMIGRVINAGRKRILRARYRWCPFRSGSCGSGVFHS